MNHALDCPTCPSFEPLNPDFRRIVRDSFHRQSLLAGFGAILRLVEPGRTVITAPVGDGVLQQDGFPHAGFGWSLGDSAAGFAALSLMAERERVLTVEMKINLLAPAAGDCLIAEGRVLRFGRTICVVTADLYAERQGQSGCKHVATMLGSMTRVRPVD